MIYKACQFKPVTASQRGKLYFYFLEFMANEMLDTKADFKKFLGH
jgi:hypothetical protein